MAMLQVREYEVVEKWIDLFGEDDAYRQYLLFAAYGKGRLGFDELPSDFRQSLCHLGWTSRGYCKWFGDALEKVLMKRGYIMEDDFTEEGEHDGCSGDTLPSP